MIIEKTKNNQVTIFGKIVSGFQFSHEAYGKKYYMVNVDICRLSGNVDCFPVMVSEELADTSKNLTGQICQPGAYKRDPAIAGQQDCGKSGRRSGNLLEIRPAGCCGF